MFKGKPVSILRYVFSPSHLANQELAKDTRRKILLGALVLHRLEQSGDGEFSKRLGDWLRRELPGFLTREEDKTLFTDILKTKADTDTKSTNLGSGPQNSEQESTGIHERDQTESVNAIHRNV